GWGAARTDGAPPARSVEVAFRVLEVVGELQPAGVGQVSRHLGLAKSTVQRALRSLDSLRYIYGSGDPVRWSLTLRAFHLGSRASALAVRDLALPEMQTLLSLTQEAIHLNILEGRSVFVLEKLDSRQAVRSYSERGESAPAHVSATGKALLAASSDAVVDHFLSEPLAALTGETIVDPARFREELARIRARGYSTNIGERRSDVCAVGAVIRDASGHPVAGIGLSAPRQRFDAPAMEAAAELVIAAAGRTSARLGWSSVDRPPGAGRDSAASGP
ncbi:MAG: IclR family transcriptional regulator, partial [Acidimicrobiales bacterium]